MSFFNIKYTNIIKIKKSKKQQGITMPLRFYRPMFIFKERSGASVLKKKPKKFQMEIKVSVVLYQLRKSDPLKAINS